MDLDDPSGEPKPLPGDGPGLLWIWNDSNDTGRDQVGDDPGPYFLEKAKAPSPITDMKTMFYGLKVAVNTSFSFEQGATFSMLLLKNPSTSKQHSGNQPRKLQAPKTVMGGCVEFATRSANPDDPLQFKLIDQFRCWGSGRALVGIERSGAHELDTIQNCFAVSKELRKPISRQILQASVVQPGLPWECALPEVRDSAQVKAATHPGILYALTGVSDEKEYDLGIFRKLRGKEIKACASYLRELEKNPISSTPPKSIDQREAKPREGVKAGDHGFESGADTGTESSPAR